MINSIKYRLAHEVTPQNPVRFLQPLELDVIANVAISVVYLYTRPTKQQGERLATMAEVICAIGHTLRAKHKMKKDSALAAKAGAFLLYSFEELKLLQLKKVQGTNKHHTYAVELLNEDAMQRLWDTLPMSKVEKLPSTVPYAPWMASRHETGMLLVKTNSKEVLNALTPQSHPIVFDTVNKAQKTGWRVNKDLLPLVGWALRNKADAFSNIWEVHNDESRRSKLREATAVLSIAKRFADKVFYH